MEGEKRAKDMVENALEGEKRAKDMVEKLKKANELAKRRSAGSPSAKV